MIAIIESKGKEHQEIQAKSAMVRFVTTLESGNAEVACCRAWTSLSDSASLETAKFVKSVLKRS